ncbi:glycosyl hydrolase catalytic core-domain-containing protein [Rhodocollybia butyracea]|uniref:Glycosyl hydrolase catalytic core-domain-containing protein n=1 Tax=Rhodocollybia butyracea TaxID=206335 RepID=A0A9P5Q6J1_9AGAR|nr:glycosyl hydrolase catalytic core-domain-containing protein [Rhodocollybia butyracea]
MAHKLLNLLAVTSLAIMACSFGAEPVNALSNGRHARDILRGHDGIAKRKRSVNGKRCKSRPTPTASSSAAVTPAPSPSSSDSSSDSSSGSSSDSSSDSSASPTSTSASASSTPTSGGGGGPVISGAKGCLAWPNGDQSYLGDYKTNQMNVIYTWGETAPSDASSLGFTFAPQLWGYTNENAFGSTVNAGNTRYALFLNEPNEPGQSNIDPQSAAGLWFQYMEPLQAQGVKVGSAATSSNPNGMDWTNQWQAACKTIKPEGCNPDFMAVHWYDISVASFESYITLWHNTFNLPIWVTEFAYQDFNGNDQGDLPTIQNFMGTVTSWMDQQDYVEAYCWFGAMLNLQGVNPLNSLMNPDGSPSPLGYQFLGSG